MEGAKRQMDTGNDVPESNDGHNFTGKRRRSAGGGSNKLPPPPLKLSPGETLFRILCPDDKTGGVIGKGGAIIRQFREETGAKIRIEDPVPACDERVILIIASSTSKKDNSEDNGENSGDEEDADVANGAEEESPAQRALVRVFERMLKVDEERLGVLGGDGEEGEEKEGSAGLVVCRLLAYSSQVGCVLGKGGKIVEKIRQESGAQVRIIAKDQIPACAAPGDEVIQIIGSVSAVRKALLSVSSCLQDNPRSDAANFPATKPSGTMLHGTGPPAQVDTFLQRGYVPGHHALDYHSRGYSSVPGPDNVAASHRKVPEEEITFRLLCSNDKVGSLIGKGGTIVRALQNDTGASIKVLDAVPESEERVVMISAFENSELKRSPAQDAVIRVHSRITESGTDKGNAVSARLLVPAQQIGCLLGKGGSIIADMRRATGASIRIFVKEQVPKCASPNEEVVQVNGGLQSVQDALFHITSRLRETVFPMKPHPNVGAGAYSSMPPEIPSPLFRSRHDPTSPRRFPPSIGLSHGMDHSTGLPHTMDHHQPAPPHSMDRFGLANGDRVHYSYSNERSGHGPSFDRPPSPRSWAPQTLNNGNPRGAADIGTGLTPGNRAIRSGVLTPVVTSTTVEVFVPQQLLRLIYGENGTNLNQIRQISGAKVIMHDPRPGATEGIVIISGTPDKTRAAQSLLQAFILCGQTSP
ncbi:RNA-binding KH domain-containing protein [Tasmannia lanceolata]|uniref:RNA-binding KH domain-containing protein n=1 Tax=Tasmannia lanceolata TaxID=3420 RepID=UPI0040637A93